MEYLVALVMIINQLYVNYSTSQVFVFIIMTKVNSLTAFLLISEQLCPLVISNAHLSSYCTNIFFLSFKKNVLFI